MAQFPAVVASIEKDKVTIETQRGPVLECVFSRGSMPRRGNKGIAVIDEVAQTVKFRGPRGAGHFRLISTN